ncbi:hypothetical protein HELRODRAFT_164387 [Helobdella robusta]|uniref:Apple domain-containing protein n=1 Tax=Helobdella robusta TaxID=6412 RepID=T1EVD0_HELRO|nr:hypothetical protein HELRODRAFT_164387 [Helobdella robusta]ESN94531.1 hypothetical protein HELRODRAFT_164387 [Helobdella robusta]
MDSTVQRLLRRQSLRYVACKAPPTSENITLESWEHDVLQVVLTCTLTCATSPNCVGFNFMKNNIADGGGVLCQFFNTTPQLYISEDLCIYFGVIYLLPGAPGYKSTWFVIIIVAFPFIFISNDSEDKRFVKS